MLQDLVPDPGLIDRLETAHTPAAVGRVLFDGLGAYGIRGLFAGSFPRLPRAALREMVEQVTIYAQISPQGWRDSYARRDLDKGNPVILALGQTPTPFRWSEGGVASLRGWAGLSLARELGMDDGIAVPCREPDGREGVVSLGFEQFRFSARELRGIQFAAQIAHERMLTLSQPAGPRRPPLTPREFDCLAFVADGRSDSEIAELIGISTNTVHSHIENAKRKLDARTRSQAVARLYLLGLA